MSIPLLHCPDCTQPLALQNNAHVCAQCGQAFGKIGAVPVLIAGAAIAADARKPSDAFLSAMDAYGTSAYSPEHRRELAGIFSTVAKFDSLDFEVEANQFLHRVDPTGVLESLLDGPAQPSQPVSARHMPGGPRVSLGLLLAPEQVPANETFSLQVHIRNEGAQRLESTGTHPYRLSYWIRKLGQQTVETEGLRTDLLIDLDPGMAITMPVAIAMPPEPGTYLITITPLTEGIAWHGDSVAEARVESVAGQTPLDVAWSRDDVPRDYAADHKDAVRLLGEWLKRHIASPDPVILEIGGNANPMIAMLDGVKFNCDVDVFGLAFGELRQRAAWGGNVNYVAASGTALPFADGTFDCICIFASFHHFFDLVGLLRHLGRKLRRGGIVCLMCEPVGHVFRATVAPEYRNELLNGVNEQSFQPWEYRDLLRKAGLDVVEAVIGAGGSLKLAATRRR
jgi:SAM-dependent methyltransferase/uncharacterized protein YbaR (Trm112 family)